VEVLQVVGAEGGGTKVCFEVCFESLISLGLGAQSLL
jgi:hypothetical protein